MPETAPCGGRGGLCKQGGPGLLPGGPQQPCLTVQHQGLPGSAQPPPAVCLPQATNARSTLALAQAAAVEAGQEGQEGTMGSPGKHAGGDGTGWGDGTREQPELRRAEGGSPLL